MAKKVVITLSVIILIMLIFNSVRNYLHNQLRKNKDAAREAQIIGPIAGYNPRVKEIQMILADCGFEPGAADGRIGVKTRQAIRGFQEAKGLKTSGRLDIETWNELNRQKEKTIGSVSPVESTKQRSEVQDEVMSYRLKSKDRTRQVQTALKKAGFYAGDVDGKVGHQTKRAIKAFQKSKGLNPDGIVGVKTWEALSGYLKE